MYGARRLCRSAEAFVANGGHLVTTYWTVSSMSPISAISGGFPGPLRNLLGIWGGRDRLPE
ncbi:beta-galactosidase trimerization domain-containing protein [Klebsiella pneumoniae]|nr:beta-galactosidase trimerization domain-containing protein [Klebsiella pneumoniae]URI72734.1 beta-galactosidase trimerization domain-containing protein [Klebsiella pneumoniae]